MLAINVLGVKVVSDKYTDTSQPELFFLRLPRKMEPIEGSETSAFKPQTPGKYPKENILDNCTSYVYWTVHQCDS